jgi:hypothetical protein
MKAIRRGSLLACMLVCSSLLICQHAQSQSADTVSSHPGGAPALQFHLVGGFGVYYLGNWSANSYYRIGADASLSFSHTSGNDDENSTSSSTSGTSTSSDAQRYTDLPGNKYLSYQVAASGLYVRPIVEYASTTLYVGGGPSVLYSRYAYSNSSTSTRIDTTSTSTGMSNGESHGKTCGIGPLALCGLKTRLISHVCLTAEVSLTAMYEWTWTSTSNSSHSTNTSSATSDYTESISSFSKGWSISLSSIRLGVIIEL